MYKRQEHYSDYYKPRTKKRTDIYVGHIQTANVECICRERVIERAKGREVRKERKGYVWPNSRKKVLTSGDRTFTAVQWDVNTVRAVSYTHLDVYKRQIYNYTVT